MHFFGHIIYKPIFNFLLTIGGICRWCFFNFINRLYDKNFSTDLNYYISRIDEIQISDKNGLTKNEKNFLVLIILFVVSAIAIEKI